MMSAVLLSLLTAAPAAGIAITQRSGVNRTLALSRADAVRAELQSARLSPVEDLTSCAGKKPCLVKAARERGWSALVTVEAAAVLDEAIINVTLLSIDDDGRVYSSANVKGPAASVLDQLPDALKPMRAALDGLLGVVPPPAPPTTPPEPIVVARTEPQPPPPPPLPPPVVVAPAERPAARWVPLVASLAVTGAGAVCFGVSVGNAERLRSGSLMANEIDALVSSGKFLQTFGLSALIAGGAASIGSLALALLWPESAPIKPTLSLAPGAAGVGLSGVFP